MGCGTCGPVPGGRPPVSVWATADYIKQRNKRSCEAVGTPTICTTNFSCGSLAFTVAECTLPPPFLHPSKRDVAPGACFLRSMLSVLFSFFQADPGGKKSMRKEVGKKSLRHNLPGGGGGGVGIQ